MIFSLSARSSAVAVTFSLSVLYFLMLGIALIGLFLRPSKLDRVIDRAIVWALHAAAVLLGRRQAYQAAGGFDTTRDMLDDVDLAFRVARIGETAKGFN